jgi:hypothetical protein
MPGKQFEKDPQVSDNESQSEEESQASSSDEESSVEQQQDSGSESEQEEETKKPKQAKKQAEEESKGVKRGRDAEFSAWIGNLSFDTQVDDLKAFFLESAEIEESDINDLRMPQDRESGRTKGYMLDQTTLFEISLTFTLCIVSVTVTLSARKCWTRSSLFLNPSSTDATCSSVTPTLLDLLQRRTAFVSVTCPLRVPRRASTRHCLRSVTRSRLFAC